MTTKSNTKEKNKHSEIDENILRLFDIKKRLGKGAYGIVWKALDKKTNETLAVKKIFDAFRDETDAQRTFREIIFLKAFRSHPNIIKLNNVYKAVNNLDIYLIFEYMESDLHNIIKKGTILKDVHKRYVMYQLINAIRYIHSGNVIHRDLKPSNVLIDSKCRCKLADFGLARSVSKRPIHDGTDLKSDPLIEPLLTDYVATRWYRAPEILVASKRYTKGIDMWSLGCILGEMIRGKPLFQGSSTINQIEKIVTALPDVTDHDIKAVGAGFGSVLLSKQISTERKTTLDELLTDAPSDAKALVKSLLVLDPLSRLTANQAISHPYVEKFRNSIHEVELNVDILPPFRDDVRLSVPEYRSKLYEIVQIPGDKHIISRNAASGKNITVSKQSDARKETLQCEHPGLQKKPSKLRQNISVPNGIDKQMHREQIMMRNEKIDPQVPLSKGGKVFKKVKSDSPVPKRTSQKITRIHSVQAETKVTIPVDAKINGVKQANKGRVRHKSSDQRNEKSKLYSLEKRHSVDSGYIKALPNHPSPPTKPSQTITITTNNSTNYFQKVGNSGRFHKSLTLVHKSDDISHCQGNLKELSSQNHNVKITTASIGADPNEGSYVRNTKSDVITTPHKNQERICYEKRLKKLEEEIEKYKKEVKSFCKESFKYANQSDGGLRATPSNVSTQSQLRVQQNGFEHNNAAISNVLSRHSLVPKTSKKNPFYNFLLKGNREHGENNHDLSYRTGGSGDHIGPTVLEKFNSTNDQRIKYDSNHRIRPLSKFI